MNFVVLYCNKNQYEMFEEFIFKHSPADFNKVTICVYDDNSDDDQKDKLRKLCKKYENILCINLKTQIKWHFYHSYLTTIS